MKADRLTDPRRFKDLFNGLQALKNGAFAVIDLVSFHAAP
jgi:hypothetical protein